MDCLPTRFDARLAWLVVAIMVTAGCGSSKSVSTQTRPGPISQNHTNVLTNRNDMVRTGQNLTETVLTSSNVKSSSFGKLFSVAVDGKVDAQPLYVSQLTMPGKGTRSVAYAATEHDSVYAFDSTSGEVLWQSSLLGAGDSPSDDRGCG